MDRQVGRHVFGVVIASLVACGGEVEQGGAQDVPAAPNAAPGGSVAPTGPAAQPGAPGGPPVAAPADSGVASVPPGEPVAPAAVDAGPPPAPRVEVDLTLSALAAHESVGLEWNAVDGATGYRLYVADAPGVDATALSPIEVTRVAYVHRGLTDGTPLYYVVSAVLPEGESAPSAEVTATPGGEWVLEELGTGLFDDVVTGGDVARVPIERRVHVLLFAEGYTDADLPVLHDVGGHAGARANDVDAFVDEVFALEPYSFFRDAFVIWYLPRASAAHIGGDTAFAVPVDLSSSFAGTGAIATDGETATRAFQAIATHPVPPTLTRGGFTRSALNHIAYFLMFDPARGRASVSGRSTSLSDPATGLRIQSSFGVPFSHEFTHAFGQLGDEYLDDARTASSFWDDTSNVVPTNVCDELPWRHLLVGGAINPDVDQLVGAFGRDGLGYHPELLCLLNGTHDNAAYYGGSGLLRTDDRMCNFCREMTAFRVFERTSVLDPASAFDTWVASYRTAFYDRFGFVVPAAVPQSNDVRNPAAGQTYYEACQ